MRTLIPVLVGTVPGVSTREFGLRRDMLSPAGDLRLVIDPIGSDGATIELRVGAVIR